MQLQKELSGEEWSVLKPAIDKQMNREGRKEKLLKRFDEDEILKHQYVDIYVQLPNVVSDEGLQAYEDMVQDYEHRRVERNWWLAYLQSFPALREKYAREYELLQKDLSEEEIRAVAVILSYEKTLLESLTWQYDAYVRETIETNYITGKVEKLYKGNIKPEELMCKYPEETEELIRYYGPEFDEFFFEKDGEPKYAEPEVLYKEKSSLRFKDMLFFKEFIERNQVFEQYEITDREYTEINAKLRCCHSPVSAGNGISGKYTEYSISYENFLLLKEQYPDKIAFYASQGTSDEDDMRFILKFHPYLDQKEVRYTGLT